MKGGHFFCDGCDDLAFGRSCQRCHGAARWVADAPRRKNEPVSVERGRVLFAQIFAVIEGVNGATGARNFSFGGGGR